MTTDTIPLLRQAFRLSGFLSLNYRHFGEITVKQNGVTSKSSFHCLTQAAQELVDIMQESSWSIQIGNVTHIGEKPDWGTQAFNITWFSIEIEDFEVSGPIHLFTPLPQTKAKLEAFVQKWSKINE